MRRARQTMWQQLFHQRCHPGAHLPRRRSTHIMLTREQPPTVHSVQDLSRALAVAISPVRPSATSAPATKPSVAQYLRGSQVGGVDSAARLELVECTRVQACEAVLRRIDGSFNLLGHLGFLGS